MPLAGHSPKQCSVDQPSSKRQADASQHRLELHQSLDAIQGDPGLAEFGAHIQLVGIAEEKLRVLMPVKVL
jgi:hypothetical protein